MPIIHGESLLRIIHTGTFFCDRTTAQSLPRTPIAMMFAAVMALNAYSAYPRYISFLPLLVRSALWPMGSSLSQGMVAYQLGTIFPGRKRW